MVGWKAGLLALLMAVPAYGFNQEVRVPSAQTTPSPRKSCAHNVKIPLSFQYPSVCAYAGDTMWIAKGDRVARNISGKWDVFKHLPLGPVTTIATTNDSVWFGTPQGALQYDGEFHIRTAPRWLQDNRVRTIIGHADAVDIYTAQGVSEIRSVPMTLEKKAAYFENIIRERHDRDGFVTEVALQRKGDVSSWKPKTTDNDGLWTALYVAAESFRYGATGNPAAKAAAKKSIDALMHLEEVTGIPGFPARAMQPVTWPDPNLAEENTLAGQKAKRKHNSTWRVIRRWPKSADGKWYWKADTSSDETDGHFFAFPIYYDLAADTPAERARIAQHVRRMMDHIIDHGYVLHDKEGVTRFGWWSPKRLNNKPWHAKSFKELRTRLEWRLSAGYRSLAILSYLKGTYHVTHDQKYQDAYLHLLNDEHYKENVQSLREGLAGFADYDVVELMYMAFHTLLQYEQDPELRAIYTKGLQTAYQAYLPDHNPFFNFVAAANLHETAGVTEGMKTLEEIPLDLVEYTVDNHSIRHRSFVLKRRGWKRPDGVFHIDETGVHRWAMNPYQLRNGSDGMREEAPTYFLLPYYLGKYYGVIESKLSE